MAKIKLGTYKSATPSESYLSFAPCYQQNNSTNITDISGKQNNMEFNLNRSGLSVVEAWATQNKISTVYAGAGATAKGFYLPLTAINSVDFSKDEGIIILCTVTVSTPATSTGFIAQGSSTTDTGLRVGITTGNVLKPSFYSSTEQLYFPDPAALTPGAPTKVLLYYGGQGGSVKFACFLNGVSNQVNISSASTSGNISPSGRVEPLYFGMYKVSANNYSSLTASFSSVHVMKVINTGTVTFNDLQDIATRYKMSPDSAFTKEEVS